MVFAARLSHVIGRFIICFEVKLQAYVFHLMGFDPQTLHMFRFICHSEFHTMPGICPSSISPSPTHFCFGLFSNYQTLLIDFAMKCFCIPQSPTFVRWTGVSNSSTPHTCPPQNVLPTVQNDHLPPQSLFRWKSHRDAAEFRYLFLLLYLEMSSTPVKCPPRYIDVHQLSSTPQSQIIIDHFRNLAHIEKPISKPVSNSKTFLDRNFFRLHLRSQFPTTGFFFSKTLFLNPDHQLSSTSKSQNDWSYLKPAPYRKTNFETVFGPHNDHGPPFFSLYLRSQLPSTEICFSKTPFLNPDWFWHALLEIHFRTPCSEPSLDLTLQLHSQSQVLILLPHPIAEHRTHFTLQLHRQGQNRISFPQPIVYIDKILTPRPIILFSKTLIPSPSFHCPEFWIPSPSFTLSKILHLQPIIPFSKPLNPHPIIPFSKLLNSQPIIPLSRIPSPPQWKPLHPWRRGGREEGSKLKYVHWARYTRND